MVASGGEHRPQVLTAEQLIRGALHEHQVLRVRSDSAQDEREEGADLGEQTQLGAAGPGGRCRECQHDRGQDDGPDAARGGGMLDAVQGDTDPSAHGQYQAV
jgi:hypothetical protein